jgi:hypothetical protein
MAEDPKKDIKDYSKAAEEAMRVALQPTPSNLVKAAAPPQGGNANPGGINTDNKNPKPDDKDKDKSKLDFLNEPAWLRIIQALIATAVIGVLFWATFVAGPYGNAILQGLSVGSTGPTWLTDSWGMIMILCLVIVLFVVFVVNFFGNHIVASIIIGVLLVMMLLLYPTIGSFFQWTGAGNGMTGLRCTLLTAFGTTPVDCLTVGTTPPVKVGKYEVLKVSFEPGIGGELYKDENKMVSFDGYQLSLQVENPSETVAVNNFKIITSGNQYNDNLDTAIVRGGTITSAQMIKLGNIDLDDQSTCTEAVPCTINPGEIKRIVLIVKSIICDPLAEVDCRLRDVCKWDTAGKVCKPNKDSITTEAVAKVRYSYEFEGEGDDVFVVGSNYDDVNSYRSKVVKTSSEGPLDVDVVFVPSAYTFSGSSQDPAVNVKIILTKPATGMDKVRPTTLTNEHIEITRTADGGLQKPANCVSSWNEQVPLVHDSRYEFADYMDLSGITVIPRISTQSNIQTYTCRYGLSQSGLNGKTAMFVPFIVTLAYTHENTAALNYIKVMSGTETVRGSGSTPAV